ncbi:signal transduction histidine kinase [Microbacterium sp. BE35]|uniref:sensor histidine kinase n=1 Tax=Microbacterium sp. BE35 TaxID=2817773 RepID=UPI002857E4FF|nr:histidine kinase [Microbacterium sp. BE35]MDR7190137.1 signal transduction histidine kinase [Microbacterium sp. BE35]
MSNPAIAFGALALATVALFSVLVPVHIALYLQPAPLAFLFGAMLCASPLVAVRFPRWSIAMCTVAAVALPLPVGEPATTWPWPWSVPAMLAFILFVGVLAVLHGWRVALLAWLLGIGGTLAVVIALAATVPVVAGIVNLVIVTSVSGAALLVAVLAASRLRVGAELTRERELTALEQSRRVLVEERARIARELHDVVAHGMSLIQVQASTARYRVPGLPDEAGQEFDEIARTAREGLTEMRRLLGVLRTEDQQADLAPQQGLRDIPDLVQALRRAGAEIDAALAPVPEAVPSAVDIAAFRIVQEALSNAVRHAPQAPIELAVETDAATLRLRVRNAASSGAPSPDASTSLGHGLLGMRERAALVGGTVSAGAHADGGWIVRASLPLAPLPPDPTPGGAA